MYAECRMTLYIFSFCGSALIIYFGSPDYSTCAGSILQLDDGALRLEVLSVEGGQAVGKALNKMVLREKAIVSVKGCGGWG